MVMWWNCMRFLAEEGLRLGELEALARTNTNLNGMERWGYVVVERDRSLIRPTSKGRMAQDVWRPLFGIIEDRWQSRFGPDPIRQLRQSLCALISQFEYELPDSLPILGYGLFSKGRVELPRTPPVRDDRALSQLPLCALLSRVLLAFALVFEQTSDLSLAISANVVRVVDEKGVRVRDLPQLGGVSKEAISMALGFLQKRGFATVEPDPAGSRAKLVRLTEKGHEARSAYHQRAVEIEERWQQRFGEAPVRALREQLEPLVGEPAASPLFRGLDPYPDGWRASVRKPQTLPHFPMVLHRGGWPDGS
jgi:DNA-binding MarR family transcriptional regulator